MYDISNEHYLAGCILLEESVIWGLDGVVNSEDFQNEHCRAIYETARALVSEGKSADPVAIRDQAKRNGMDLPDTFILELMDIVPTTANYSEYAKRVVEDARLRKIRELAAEAQFDDSSTPDELIEKLQEGTARLKNKDGKSDFLSLFKPLDEFTEEDATWLIPNWIPETQITLMSADGGVGKTTLWCHIIAALSSGRSCILDPPGYKREPKKIAFCTTEDSVKKKLLKKLRLAGANLKNIITMDFSEDTTGALRNFKFGSNELSKFIKHYQPALCVFDPVQGFLPPKINTSSRAEMRDCMAPLIPLGEDNGTTFLVISHTNKRKGASGRDRIADSADLWDIARSVIMAGYTENQGVRYLSNEKNNYSQLQETMLFSIDSSGCIFKEGSTWKRDKDYMMEAATAKSAPKKEDCRDFILHTLEEAPGRCMKSDELNKLAESYGYSFATIKRVRAEMSNDGTLEKYTTGSSKKGNRVHYIRLPVPNEPAFHELPYELPVPFDNPSN